MNDTTLYQVTLKGPRAAIEILSNLLDSQAISSFEVDAKNDLWRLQAIYESKPCLDNLQALIHSLDFDPSKMTVLLESLPACDWLAENRKSFPPLELGSFYIYGSHHEDLPLPSSKICLHIDAATAFGTGQHATTQGCLLLLESLKDAPIKNGLDVGTGTGILAMAAVRFLNVPFVAVDIDADAVAMAAENVIKNKLQDQIQVGFSDGADTSLVKDHAPYDLIFANILAEPLVQLAPDLTAQATENSILILSGLMNHQAESVSDAYKAEGWTLNASHVDGDWSSLLLKRRS